MWGRRIAALVAAVATGTGLLLSGGLVDDALGAPVAAVTGVSIEETNAAFEQPLTLEVAFTVADPAVGDTFTVSLPASLRALAHTFSVTGPGGVVVATVVVNGADLEFALTPQAAGFASLTGTATVAVATVAGAVTAGVTNDFTFGSGGATFTDSVRLAQPVAVDRSGAVKTGSWTPGTDDDITWLLDFPSAGSDRATLRDTPGPGQAIDCSSVRATQFRSIDAQGQPSRPVVEKPTEYAVTCSSGSLLFTNLFGTPPGGLLRVEVHTKVTEATRTVFANSVKTSFVAICPVRIATAARARHRELAALGPCDSGTASADASVSRPVAAGTAQGAARAANIDVEKFSTALGGVAGDFDAAPGRALVAGQPEPLSIVVTNSGTTALTDVAVSDRTVAGPAAQGLTCDFSPLGGPATGTTWPGPFARGRSFTCRATVPAMAAGAAHHDSATVTAVGGVGGAVSDSDGWYGAVAAGPGVPPPPPPAPGPAPVAAVDIEKWSTRQGAHAGDHDTVADRLTAGVPTDLTFSVRNTGEAALTDLRVDDSTSRGPDLQGLSCDFSAVGGPDHGRSWHGPLAPHESFTCTARVPALRAGRSSKDVGAVHASAQASGAGAAGAAQEVSDSDPWLGRVPADGPGPGTPHPGHPHPGPQVLPDTGGPAPWLPALAVAALALGLASLRRRRSGFQPAPARVTVRVRTR